MLTVLLFRDERVRSAALLLRKAAPKLWVLHSETQTNRLLDDNGPFAIDRDDFTAWVESSHEKI